MINYIYYFEDASGKTATLSVEPCRRKSSHVIINVTEHNYLLHRDVLTYAVMMPLADETGIAFELQRTVDKLTGAGYQPSAINCFV